MCRPCLRGTYCEQLGLAEPTQCTPGYRCDIQKLTSPREECTPGHYCPLGTMGNLPYENGLYDNQTYHCPIGVYCRGGMETPDLPADIEADDFGVVPTECLPGMVCH